MVRKINNVLNSINSLSNPKNKNALLTYYNSLVDRGIASNTIINNLIPTIYFCKYLDSQNIMDVKDKQTIISFLNTVVKLDDQEKKYITTWNTYMQIIKAFYRWAYNNDNGTDVRFWETPDFCKIKKKLSKRVSPYNNNDIWEKDEIVSILKYEITTRNKAIISLLWDLDARPHEVVLLKIKNVRLREKYGEGEIPFTAKTGSGPILLTFSFPYVRDWLNNHPDRNNGEAPLICTIKGGTPISTGFIYNTMINLRDRIKRLVITGGISDQRERERMEYFLNTKKWNPYCIRHSAITSDSDFLPEYALKKKVRWSMNSKQGSRYIKNRMGDELRNKILEQNGIIIDIDLKPKPTIITCPRCELVNQIENKFCSKCSYPLSPQAFDEIKKDEDARFKEMEDKQQKEIQDMKRILETLMQKVDYSKLKP